MVDSFGPERLVWGSDVGQSMLWSYAEKVAMAKAATDLLSDEEAGQFLHDNAARLYDSARRRVPRSALAGRTVRRSARRHELTDYAQ